MTKGRGAPRRTILAVGEGETEQAFLRFLKQTYVPRKGGPGVKVRLGRQGGDLQGSIKKALRICESEGFDKVFLLRDLDTEEFVSGEERNGVLLLGSKPCVEGMFLDIVAPQVRRGAWTSIRCKRHFESNYLDEKKKLDSRNYSFIFQKQFLEEARKRIPALNEILNMFEDTS